MKYLLVILIVVAVLWLVRRQQHRIPPAPREKGGAAQEPMVACAQCGLHLPRSEALPGRGGVFCGEAHRAAYEKAHPTT
jgi:uncharacterized protein